MRKSVLWCAALVAAPLALLPTAPASADAGAIVSAAECTEHVLEANDDGSTPEVRLPFGIRFYDDSFERLYVNNNGNVTFDAPLSTYTPFGLAATQRQIIAPFFADVDTRAGGSDRVRYGWGDTTYEGRQAFCVNWLNVGYYNGHADKLNSFQLLLVRREDTGSGNFDIVFNYGTVNWETGDASGGSGGLGGAPARAGFSNGTGTAGSSYELPGSGVTTAFLDGSPGGLARTATGSAVPGRHVFQVRAGRPGVQHRYVALGDSFQSGEGTFDYLRGTDEDGNRCHRSDRAYPKRIAVPFRVDFWACSGAVINDLRIRTDGGGAPWDDGADGKTYLDRLDDDTKLVTVGIGGNDMEFADILAGCIKDSLLDLNPFADNSCENDYGDRVEANLTRLTTKNGNGLTPLEQLYDDIRRNAPLARMLVLGYPRFYVEGGAHNSHTDDFCGGVRIADQRWINNGIRALNTAIKAAAARVGGQFVDVYATPNGHELCSGAGDHFLNGIAMGFTGPKPESYHPTVYGHSLLTGTVGSAFTAPPPGTLFNVLPGQTVTSPVQVAPGTTLASFATSWPGSDVVLSLRSPSGRVIDRGTTAGDLLHRSGPISESYAVTDPEPGTWTVSLFGADVAAAGEPTYLDVWQQAAPNLMPVPAIGVTQTGHTVTVDAAASRDPDGRIVEYVWEFGDGTVATGPRVSHTFQQGGEFLVTLAVRDDRGGEAFAAARGPLTIRPYRFVGFQSPVPAAGSVNAGRAVPMKFSLGGDHTLTILRAGYPVSRRVDCATGAALGADQATTSAGGSRLSYDPATDTYTYAWKTAEAWRGTCRTFTLGLDDGSTQTATFRFV
jgi:hypothetical protein